MNPEHNDEANSQQSPAPEQNVSATEGAQAATQQDSAQQSNETGQQQAGSSDESNKLFPVLGYILPFLFFIPLLSDDTKHDPFIRFHANQQAILLILCGVIYVLHNVLYMGFMIGSLFPLISTVLNIAALVFVVLGVINAAKGEMKRLPLIGGFSLL